MWAAAIAALAQVGGILLQNKAKKDSKIPGRYDPRNNTTNVKTDNRIALMIGGILIILIVVVAIPTKK